MTRYSRSVIPGRRPAEADDSSNLDRAVFGAKKKPVQPPANDSAAAYADPMDMEVDEAGFLVERSERRKDAERRRASERRREDGRRKADFPPLRSDGVAYRTADDGKRGPILLVGALVIVAVFGVVVWNAYREGVKTDDPEASTPQLATAGAFKTPPHEVKDAPILGDEPAEVLEQLDGGPSGVIETPVETRIEPKVVVPAPAPAVAAPAPSKFAAPPPAPLKSPVLAAPVLGPVLGPVSAPVSAPATPPAAKPVETLTAATAVVKTSSTQSEPPKPSAAVPPAPSSQAAAFKPAFAANGAFVVQIAAPSTETSAVAEWDKRAKALPEFFAAAERYVVKADVNGKTVYRLRAGPFATKADADAFCAAYKAKGGNCFPAAK